MWRRWLLKVRQWLRDLSSKLTLFHYLVRLFVSPIMILFWICTNWTMTYLCTPVLAHANRTGKNNICWLVNIKKMLSHLPPFSSPLRTPEPKAEGFFDWVSDTTTAVRATSQRRPTPVELLDFYNRTRFEWRGACMRNRGLIRWRRWRWASF